MKTDPNPFPRYPASGATNTGDWVTLTRRLWDGKRTIIITAVISVALGVAYALLRADSYTATTVMVPQTNSATPSQLSGLASLAGISLDMSQGNELSPVVYPRIINSISFKIELMHTAFSFEGFSQPVSLYEYYSGLKPGVSVEGGTTAISALSGAEQVGEGHQQSATPALSGSEQVGEGHQHSATPALSGAEQVGEGHQQSATPALSGSEQVGEGHQQSSSPVTLSKEQVKVKRILDKNIYLAIDKKDGFLTLRVTLPEAAAAAQVALKVQELLQREIVQLRTEKAQADLDFIQQRYNEVKAEAEGYQEAMVAGSDRFKDLVSNVPKINNSRMQTRYNITNSVFQELAKQLEQAKIQVKRDTPVFTVIEPVAVPYEKNGRGKIFIVLLFGVAGTVLGTGLLLFIQSWPQLKQRWANGGN